MIELTPELTEEEQALLNEVNSVFLVESPGRKVPGYTDEDARRNEVFKSLVYKDLINFSIGKPHYYIFFSRQDGRF